jgi:chloramphenicol 3-O-phosphotransferase
MAPIFLLIGGPAVGKTTTAKLMAARFQKCLLIHVDEIRNMVVSGIELPGVDWGSGLVEQLALARKSTTYMANSYSAAGFTVVIDDFWDPYSHLEEYVDLSTHPQVYKIILMPGQDSAHQRNLQRSGPGPLRDYLDGGIRLVYESLHSVSADLQSRGWLMLDTTDLTVDETVDGILAFSAAEKA